MSENEGVVEKDVHHRHLQGGVDDNLRVRQPDVERTEQEVETDEDKIGLELEPFKKISKKEYLKYHSFYQMPNIIENDI